jgi:transposase InsO family protein
MRYRRPDQVLKIPVSIHRGKIVGIRGAALSITVDNGTEFSPKAMGLWAYANGVHLDFIRPGRAVENGYIGSFNGRLRDQCLNVEVFFTLADARRKQALCSMITTIAGHTRLWPIAHRQNPQLYAAMEKTAIRPPWKTLRVYHFPSGHHSRVIPSRIITVSVLLEPIAVDIAICEVPICPLRGRLIDFDEVSSIRKLMMTEHPCGLPDRLYRRDC